MKYFLIHCVIAGAIWSHWGPLAVAVASLLALNAGYWAEAAERATKGAA